MFWLGTAALAGISSAGTGILIWAGFKGLR